MDRSTFVYVTYIATTLEQLWDALTSEAFTQQYWQTGHLQSDWQAGSPVEHIDSEGEPGWQGEVLQSEPPYRLAYSFQPPSTTEVQPFRGTTEVQPFRVRFELEQYGSKVKLTLIHDRLDTQSCMNASRKWTLSLSYLKRLLEIEEALALVA